MPCCRWAASSGPPRPWGTRRAGHTRSWDIQPIKYNHLLPKYRIFFFLIFAETKQVYSKDSKITTTVFNKSAEILSKSCSTKNRSFSVTNFKIGHFLVTQDKTAAWRPHKLGNEGLHVRVLSYATKKCPILKFATPPIFDNICHFRIFSLLLRKITST